MPKVIIIAEAGVNHCGSLERALAMVDAAAEAGVDYVKFQTFKAAKLVSANAPKAGYQEANDPSSGSTQLEMLRRLELSAADFATLAARCREKGIGFLSTPFDLDSIRDLAPLGMDYWKIPSGEITNLPYLRAIGSRGESVILSTGMSDLDEVEAALRALEEAGTPRSKVILLHCNTQYPTPMADVNLRAMEPLRTLGAASVGYSDHTLGTEVPVAAAALGASVIEKHFTLSRDLPGPDHKASLTPAELALMVSQIRNIELALGDGSKRVSDSERPNIAVARKSIVASRPIARGETLSSENLAVKRPGTGLSPMLWDSVTGTQAVKDFAPDEPITL
ncbi:MAG: N-acetylneuraminate synthase [[Clostridium] fimetarium]|nr:N-acetylneuraminate synthase [Alistipes timonensis]MCM1405297.1 N-acetylneuraminate synthase [[Clostridium] fimetarium]